MQGAAPTSLQRLHVAVLRLCMAASGAQRLHSRGGGAPAAAPLLLVSFLFRLFRFERRREEVADFEDLPDGGSGHHGGGGVARLGRAETPFRWASTTLLPVVLVPCEAHLSVQLPGLQALLLHTDLLGSRWENVAGRLRSALGRSLGRQGFGRICFAVRCEMHGVNGLGHLGSFYFLRLGRNWCVRTPLGAGLNVLRKTQRGGASDCLQPVYISMRAVTIKKRRRHTLKPVVC